VGAVEVVVHLVPLPLPQASIPLAISTRIATMPRIFRNFFRRAGIPNRKTHASTAPPPAYHGIFRGASFDDVQGSVLLAVVEMVSVAVPAAAPVMPTGVVVPKLNVGGMTAFAGLAVTAAVSATLPVNPPPGVTLIVEVFPVVAPGSTVTAVPVIAKLGLVTVTDAVPLSAT
jgi:hypothetical protein